MTAVTQLTANSNMTTLSNRSIHYSENYTASEFTEDRKKSKEGHVKAEKRKMRFAFFDQYHNDPHGKNS